LDRRHGPTARRTREPSLPYNPCSQRCCIGDLEPGRSQARIRRMVPAPIRRPRPRARPGYSATRPAKRLSSIMRRAQRSWSTALDFPEALRRTLSRPVANRRLTTPRHRPWQCRWRSPSRRGRCARAGSRPRPSRASRSWFRGSQNGGHSWGPSASHMQRQPAIPSHESAGRSLIARFHVLVRASSDGHGREKVYGSIPYGGSAGESMRSFAVVPLTGFQWGADLPELEVARG
jgi:hypothetical protein